MQCADRILDQLVVQRALRNHLNDEIVAKEMEEQEGTVVGKRLKLFAWFLLHYIPE